MAMKSSYTTRRDTILERGQYIQAPWVQSRRARWLKPLLVDPHMIYEFSAQQTCQGRCHFETART